MVIGHQKIQHIWFVGTFRFQLFLVNTHPHQELRGERQGNNWLDQIVSIPEIDNQEVNTDLEPARGDYCWFLLSGEPVLCPPPQSTPSLSHTLTTQQTHTANLHYYNQKFKTYLSLTDSFSNQLFWGLSKKINLIVTNSKTKCPPLFFPMKSFHFAQINEGLKCQMLACNNNNKKSAAILYLE